MQSGLCALQKKHVPGSVEHRRKNESNGHSCCQGVIGHDAKQLIELQIGTQRFSIG